MLKDVTLEEVQQLYRDYIGGEHGEIVVVGDFEDEATLAKLESVFEGWTAEKPYARIENPRIQTSNRVGTRSIRPTKRMQFTLPGSRRRFAMMILITKRC